jgi:hypothetical protein
VVAVDSPPGWALAGRSRAAERELARLGIHSYAVPVDPGDHAFYSWMRTGFEVFSRLAAVYPLYLQGESVLGHCVEVFPHASAVVLAGSLQPPGWSKSRWRRSILAQRGIQDKGLHSTDLVDAALAALTGLEALDGNYCAVGDPREGSSSCRPGSCLAGGIRRARMRGFPSQALASGIRVTKTGITASAGVGWRFGGATYPVTTLSIGAGCVARQRAAMRRPRETCRRAAGHNRRHVPELP